MKLYCMSIYFDTVTIHCINADAKEWAFEKMPRTFIDECDTSRKYRCGKDLGKILLTFITF